MTPEGRCVCGLDYVRGLEEDEVYHAEVHEEYAKGCLMPTVANLPADPVASPDGYRLVWINSTLRPDVRREAAQIAYVECRELNRPVCYDGSETHERPRRLVALHGDRAVGFVMIGDGVVHWRLRWRPDGVEALSRDRIAGTNPGIGRVWIAANHRGRGLASAMIARVAKHTGVTASDFVWTIPLTAGGARLVRSMCPDFWLADGEWGDLFKLIGEG